jgi:two-component system osmolarity sensor histidine kinase EnvZ
LTQEIAAIADLHGSYPGRMSDDLLVRIAQSRLNIDIEFLPKGELPPALPKPFFSIVDAALSNEIKRQIGKPFWLDTVGRSNFIEIRIVLDDAILRVVALRSAAYASNSHIFLLWMIGTSFVLIIVAIAFLGNQIKPILSLAGAAEAFGKGRDLEFQPRCRPRGAPGGLRLCRNEAADRARHRAAHHHTEWGEPRSSHHPHEVQAVARLDDRDHETRDLQKDIDEMQRMLRPISLLRGVTPESARLKSTSQNSWRFAPRRRAGWI